jgi:hypothetical protein
MALKFRRGTTAQKSGSLAFGEPYVNTTLGTLQIGGDSADITLSAVGTGSNLLINEITASHIIPSETNTYDLGSETNYWRDLYISTGSIKFVAGGTVVGSIASGSSATTGSNIFIGDQTITGSLYISQNFYVQGSSSFQNITASVVSIGTNTVILNTDSPAVRFGGVSVQDSGSGAGASGSLLWDSQENVWIYQNPDGAGYASAKLISGPKNSGSLGNEGGLTVGQVPVAVGDDHIGNSIISASSTKVTIAGDFEVTGNSSITGIGDVSTYSSSIASRVGQLESDMFNVTASVQAINIWTSSVATSASVASATATSISTLSGSVFTTYAKLAGANTFTTNQIVSGSITATGDIVAYSTSDKRHKHNIVNISDALLKVTKLNGVTWEWNEDVDDATKETPKTGLIAQEVQEVLPEVVKERGDGFLALDYSKTIGLLVEAIKEQQTQIHSLTLEIEKLKKNNSL